jgi:hypothetical protein
MKELLGFDSHTIARDMSPSAVIDIASTQAGRLGGMAQRCDEDSEGTRSRVRSSGVPCRRQGNVVTPGEHVTEGKHAEAPSLEEGGR